MIPIFQKEYQRASSSGQLARFWIKVAANTYYKDLATLYATKPIVHYSNGSLMQKY